MNGLKCMHTQTQLCMLSIRGSFHIKTDTEKEQSFHENVNKERAGKDYTYVDKQILGENP